MLYKHWSDFDMSEWEWPNFTPEELSCKHCGEYYHDPDSLNKLQKARSLKGKPFIINSARRCEYYNDVVVKGSANSIHKRWIAFDISLSGHNKKELMKCLFDAGFTTFGMYNTFIHVDTRDYRRWYSVTGVIKKEWQAIYDDVVKRSD